MFCYVCVPANWKLSFDKGSQLLDAESASMFYIAPVKPKSDTFVQAENGDILILEGVVTNAKRLINSFALGSLQELILRCTTDNALLAKLDGQFFIVRYNFAKNELTVFSNATNTIRIFYYNLDGVFIVADKIKTIVQILKANGVACQVDEIGARMLLSYRFMLDNYTTVANIKQIGNASFLKYTNHKLERGRYLQWTAEIVERTVKQTQSDLRDLFSTAVRDAYEWDGEAKHFAFLSGGLDSRMSVYTAHQLGIKDITTMNFADPGYADDVISKAIAKELSYKLLHYSLANGDYLKQLDKNLAYNEGQIALHAASHLYAAISSIDLTPYGIMHTGLVGDILKGDCLNAAHHNSVNPMAFATSTKLLPAMQSELNNIARLYPNHEHFLLNSRELNGMINGDLACYRYSHAVSPFLNPEMLQYCLSIDPAYRYKNKCYIEWLKAMHPAAAKHKWEKTNAPVSDPFWLVRAKYTIFRGSNKAIRVIFKKPERHCLITMDYWWQTNKSLRDDFNDNIAKLAMVKQHFNNELWQDTSALLASPSFVDKSNAYTLLSASNYFLNED